MASISVVRGKYRALIRRQGRPEQSKSFKTREEAVRWARSVEHSLDAGKPVLGGKGPRIDALIETYRAARTDAGRPISPTATEHYTLLRLREHFEGVRLESLDTPALVRFARQRRGEGVGPYTALLDVTKLGTVLRYACSLEGHQYHEQVRAAMPTLRHLKLVGPGNERDRRPTADEMARILRHLEQRVTGVPMVDIVQFASITGMRLGEIVRIRWADYDAARRIIVVRDRKDPRQKAGNDQRVPLLFGSHDIIDRQPREDECIFPYKGGTISDHWTETCQTLGIEDLVFHDLRHEAISRMFEAGMDIPAVAAVSGHKDWKHLRRYTQLSPEAIALEPVNPARRR